MRLIGIRDRLVKEKRIRPEDMHIMANILPSNEFNDIERISTLQLTLKIKMLAILTNNNGGEWFWCLR